MYAIKIEAYFVLFQFSKKGKTSLEERTGEMVTDLTENTKNNGPMYL